MDTLDIVQGAHSDWTISMDSVDIVHCLPMDNVHELSGQCPWAQWKVWTLSIDTMDKVRADWKCPPNPWAPWTLSMDKVHSFVLTELVKKT